MGHAGKIATHVLLAFLALLVGRYLVIDMPFTPDTLAQAGYYALASLVVELLFRVERAPWRFVSASDHLRLFRSAVLTAEDWGLARGPFLKILAERVEAIASGRFPIRPEEGERGHCSWCEFPTVCRKAHGPSRAHGLRAFVPGA